MTTVRMYHPHVGREIEVPDDEDCIAVHAEVGWLLAPEPVARPGYEPEPVIYAPVVPEPEPVPSGKAAKAKTTDT